MEYDLIFLLRSFMLFLANNSNQKKKTEKTIICNRMLHTHLKFCSFLLGWNFEFLFIVVIDYLARAIFVNKFQFFNIQALE